MKLTTSMLECIPTIKTAFMSMHANIFLTGACLENYNIIIITQIHLYVLDFVLPTQSVPLSPLRCKYLHVYSLFGVIS